MSIPGISSVAALAAAHGLVLNRVGAPVLITTGRRLAEEGMPRDVDDVVVMLDGRAAFADLPDTDLDIFWGAYLGTPDEILVSGDLHAVRDEIVTPPRRGPRPQGLDHGHLPAAPPLKMTTPGRVRKCRCPPLRSPAPGSTRVERSSGESATCGSWW